MGADNADPEQAHNEVRKSAENFCSLNISGQLSTDKRCKMLG